MATSVRQIRWRTDVTLSTSSASRVLRPAVLLQLELGDGQLQLLDLDINSFGELRSGVAELLSEMEWLQSSRRKKARAAAAKPTPSVPVPSDG